MAKTIAVVIDEVLNNFADMLGGMGITYNSRVHSIADPLLKKCLYDMESGNLTEIARKAMGSAVARQDGLAFMRWLEENGWTVVLCTERDLRFAYDITAKWLSDNRIRYDCLFAVGNIDEFCRDMDIKYLICSRHKRIETELNVFCFCPGAPEICNSDSRLQQFSDFEKVKQCIQKNLSSTSFTQQSTAGS